MEIALKYAETGDSVLLHFGSNASVEELKRAGVEYAPSNAKTSGMILLQSDGTTLAKSQAKLGSSLTSEDHAVFLFSKETLSKSFISLAAYQDFAQTEIKVNSDEERAFKESVETVSELCHACAGRCRVQIDAAAVAVKNSVEHAKAVSSSFSKFRLSCETQLRHQKSILDTFDEDFDKLSRVVLAKQHSIAAPGSQSVGDHSKKTMIEMLPVDKIKRWAHEAKRQYTFVEKKLNDLVLLEASVQQGLSIVLEQEKDSERVEKLLEGETESIDEIVNKADYDEEQMSGEKITEHALRGVVTRLANLKQQTSKSLFLRLVTVSARQSEIQDFGNKIAALKEGLLVQEQLVSQIAVVQSLPRAYRESLIEADRRRAFALAFSDKVQKLTDFLSEERDAELAMREEFHRGVGKFVPADLVPGLSPWVFPAVEVTQRALDPLLFANVLRFEPASGDADIDTHKAVLSAETEGTVLIESDNVPARGGLDDDDDSFDPFRVLELQAENELLRGQENGNALNALKQRHEAALDALRERVKELEMQLASTSVDKTD